MELCSRRSFSSLRTRPDLIPELVRLEQELGQHEGEKGFLEARRFCLDHARRYASGEKLEYPCGGEGGLGRVLDFHRHFKRLLELTGALFLERGNL